ncbi:hypothetical protein A3Q56_04540 [Intoshia linei]|uniref:Uncharacterized protein n=1 Tax=Intoshia linei TaxID=1819745 RepID=A0A177B2T3_9BILA|nr:hypothetical protein A3Q56_04540 [Intoshia linei]
MTDSDIFRNEKKKLDQRNDEFQTCNNLTNFNEIPQHSSRYNFQNLLSYSNTNNNNDDIEINNFNNLNNVNTRSRSVGPSNQGNSRFNVKTPKNYFTHSEYGKMQRTSRYNPFQYESNGRIDSIDKLDNYFPKKNVFDPLDYNLNTQISHNSHSFSNYTDRKQDHNSISRPQNLFSKNSAHNLYNSPNINLSYNANMNNQELSKFQNLEFTPNMEGTNNYDSYVEALRNRIQFLNNECGVIENNSKNNQQRLNSTLASIKMFWNPELKRERAMKNEEIIRHSIADDKCLMYSKQNENMQSLLEQFSMELTSYREDCVLNFNLNVKNYLEMHNNVRNEIMQNIDSIKSDCIKFTENKCHFDEKIIFDLISEIVHKVECVESLENKCSASALKLSRKISELKFQVDQMDLKKEKLSEEDKNKILERHKRINNTIKSLKNATCINNEICGVIKNFTISNDDLPLYDTLKTQDKILKAKLENKRFEITQKTCEITAYKTEIETLGKKEKDYLNHINILKDQIKAKDQQIIIYLAHMDILRERLQEKDSSILMKTQISCTANTDRKRIEITLADLNEKNAILESKLNISHTKITTLESIIDKHKNKNDEIVNDENHQKLNQTIDNLEKTISLKNVQRIKLMDEHSIEKQNLQKNINILQSQNNVLEQKIKFNSKQKANNVEIENLKKTLQSYEEHLKSAINENKNLSNKINSYNNDISEYHKRITELKQEIISKNKYENELKCQYIEIENDNKSKTIMIEEYEEEIANLSGKMEECYISTTAANEEFEKKKSVMVENEKLKKEIKQLKATESTLNGLIVESSKKINFEKENIIKLTEEINVLQRENVKYRNRIDLINDSNVNAGQKKIDALLEELDQKDEDLKNELKFKDKNFEDLSKNFTQKMQEMEKLLMNKERTMSEMTKKMTTINEEKSSEIVNNLTQKISQLESELFTKLKIIESMKNTEFSEKQRNNIENLKMEKLCALISEAEAHIALNDICGPINQKAKMDISKELKEKRDHFKNMLEKMQDNKA